MSANISNQAGEWYMDAESDDCFFADDGVIEIMDEYGDSGTIYASNQIIEIFQDAPTGEVVNFQPQISIPCDCGECKDIFVVHADGTVEIEKEIGDCYTTKIDPRYCSAIYRHVKTIEDKAQAEAELFAEMGRGWDYVRADIAGEVI